MPFSKTNFVDNQTVIDAATLNAIQDELIRVAGLLGKDIQSAAINDSGPSDFDADRRHHAGRWRCQGRTGRKGRDRPGWPARPEGSPWDGCKRDGGQRSCRHGPVRSGGG